MRTGHESGQRQVDRHAAQSGLVLRGLLPSRHGHPPVRTVGQRAPLYRIAAGLALPWELVRRLDVRATRWAS